MRICLFLFNSISTFNRKKVYGGEDAVSQGQNIPVVQVSSTIHIVVDVATFNHRKILYWREPRLDGMHFEMVPRQGWIAFPNTFQPYIALKHLPRIITHSK